MVLPTGAGPATGFADEAFGPPCGGASAAAAPKVWPKYCPGSTWEPHPLVTSTQHATAQIRLRARTDADLRPVRSGEITKIS